MHQFRVQAFPHTPKQFSSLSDQSSSLVRSVVSLMVTLILIFFLSLYLPLSLSFLLSFFLSLYLSLSLSLSFSLYLSLSISPSLSLSLSHSPHIYCFRSNLRTFHLTSPTSHPVAIASHFLLSLCLVHTLFTFPIPICNFNFNFSTNFNLFLYLAYNFDLIFIPFLSMPFYLFYLHRISESMLTP